MQVSKELDETCRLNRVNERKKKKKKAKIFDRVNSYNDTNNLCKFQKDRIQNVDLIE